MKNKNIFNIKTILSVFIFTTLVLSGVQIGHAQTAASTDEPVIQTSKTPYGQSIIVNFPQNYSGEVSSSFDGSEWKTTTKKYTQADLDVINKKIKDQQEVMNKLFEEQQKFFQQFWSSWPSFWF